MNVREFLSNYRLIENTYNIFNYDTLAARLNIRFGNQRVRCDMDPTQIQMTAQNTIDINREYFTVLFSNVVNPYETWTEMDTHTDSGTEDKTTTITGKNTTAHTGTITNTNTGTITNSTTTKNTTTGTNHSDNPTSTTTTNNVNAYNTITAVPQNNSNTTNTNVSDGNYTDTTNATTTNTETRNTTATQTLNNTDTNDTTNNGTEKTTRNNSGNYKKSGFSVNDYIAANRAYYAAYDIVIDYLARDILITVPNWGC